MEAIKRGGVFGVGGITYPGVVGTSERKENGLHAVGGGSENGSGSENGNGGVCKKGRLEFLELDLADLNSVERCAEELSR